MMLKSQTHIQKVASILAQSFIDDPCFEFILGENANKSHRL